MNETVEDLEKIPTTIPSNLNIKLSGFLSEEEARKVGDYVGACIGTMSKCINAERLDGITIAHDYDDALATLDRGKEGLRPLGRSTEHATGVGMAATVIREGVIKAHIVLHAEIAKALLDASNGLHNDAIYILAHELGHVCELKFRDEALPNTIFQPRKSTDRCDIFLSEIAEACWEEYAACRLSASFYPGQIKNYEETFLSMLAKSEKDIQEAKLKWKNDRDTGALMYVASDRYGNLIKYASYMIGHVHGLGTTLDNVAPNVTAVLNGSYFEDTYSALEEKFAAMYTELEQWKGTEIYDDLKDIVWQCFRDTGLLLTSKDDEMYVYVK